MKEDSAVAFLCRVALCLVLSGLGLMSGPIEAKDKDIDAEYLALKDCPDEPGCPAIYLLDETVLNDDLPHPKLSRRLMIKVFTADAIDEYADVEVQSVAGSIDIRGLSGRTILPDGTVIPLDQDNVSVKTSLKRGKTRFRTKTAKFPGVVPGAIIDCSWDLVSPRSSNFTEHVWQIQQRIPVLLTRIDVKGGEIPFKSLKTGLQEVEVHHEKPDKRTDRFWAKDIPSLPEEPLGPPDDAVRARMYFFISDLQMGWMGDYAGRVAGFAADYIGEAPGVHEAVARLVAAGDTPLEKVKKIYRFVQEKVGSEEQRLEETGEDQSADPTSIDEVLTRGYGDAGDRAILFVAMAQAAGLDSALLLIASRDETLLDTRIPDDSQFDTFAAAVQTGGNRWTFYDPAVRHCPFGMISSSKEGGVPNAILVAPRKGAGEPYMDTIANTLIPRHRAAAYQVASIPFSVARKNVLTREATVTLTENGEAEVVVTDKGTGLVDLDHRAAYADLPEEKRKEALLSHLRDGIPRAQLERAEFTGIDSFDDPATMEYAFTVDGLAPPVGGRILLTPSIFDAARPVPLTSESRVTPVNFPHTQRTVERISFELPPGYEVDELPKPTQVREGPFSFVANCILSDGKLILTRRLEIGAAVWSVADYPRLRAFFQKVQESDRQVVVLKQGSPS